MVILFAKTSACTFGRVEFVLIINYLFYTSIKIYP